nr:PREDICTED: probable malonyl-CoA-acyl carrier protein transacylase, mitochondrial isoform X2 [Megachile rotundata]
MIQRISFGKLLPYLPKCYRINQYNQISNNATRDEGNISDTLHTEESLKDVCDNENELNEEKVSQLLKESATFTDATDKSWSTTPYPKDIVTKQNEERKEIDPTTKSVFLFPGQGTIKVGMIKKYIKFPVTKELFKIANEIINYDLLNLCMNGPQQKLNRTEYNQICTVVSSLAALEKVREESPEAFENCIATAGYSVGEITALIFSGAITFEDGIRLVWARGKAMQAASDKVPQGMVSVFCDINARLSEACTNAEKWALDLGVEQPTCRKILAGSEEALKYIKLHHAKYGLSNVNQLPVSGAFHTRLMEPALESVFQALKSIEVHEPRCKVYSNVTTTPYSNLRYMKKWIMKQIVSPVKWEQCMQKIYSRPDGVAFPQTYDVGSEGRMKSILNLINAKACKSCVVI